MENELGKCPFCASDEVQMDDRADGFYEIDCTCGANSGIFMSRDQAVETWNNASEAVERTRD